MISLFGTRLAAALTVLFALILLQLTVPDVLPIVVAVALIVLPVIQWATVVFFALRALEDPTIISLRARVQDAVALAIASTVGAVLGLIVVARQLNVIPPVDRGVFLVGISFALLMTAAPAINWLITWRPWKPLA